MAETTERLIGDCDKAKERLDEAVKDSLSALKDLENAVAQVERLKDDADRKNASKLQETAVSSRTFAKGALARIELAQEQAKTPIKALESKVKVKSVLDVFKTQKTLERAKTALEQAKESNTTATSKLKELQKEYAGLDKRVNAQSDRTTLIWHAQPIVEDLTDFRAKLLPQAGREVEDAFRKIKEHAVAVKRFEHDIETKEVWSAKEHEQRVQEIKQTLKLLEEQKTALNNASGRITEALMTPRWDEYATVKKFPPVKAAYAEAQKLEKVVMQQVDEAHDLIQECQTNAEGLVFDMGTLQTTDGPLRDEETQLAALNEAKKKMERLYTLVVHGIDDFKQDGADLQEFAPSLKKYTKPEQITETEWEQLEERQHRLHQESRQLAQLFGNLKRAFSQAQKLQKRFSTDTELSKILQSMKQKFVEKGKHYVAYTKMVPVVQKCFDTVLKNRPM